MPHYPLYQKLSNLKAEYCERYKIVLCTSKCPAYNVGDKTCSFTEIEHKTLVEEYKNENTN